MRAAIFHPAVLEAIRSFPVEVRRELGKALSMPLARPMVSIAARAAELRILDRAGIYRVFYLVKSARGILVFHAFAKKSRGTPRQEVELGRMRLKELLDEES